MKNIIFRIAGMLIFAILLSSCGSSRAHLSDKNEPQPKKPSTSKKVITAAPPQVKLNTASPEALPKITEYITLPLLHEILKGHLISMAALPVTVWIALAWSIARSNRKTSHCRDLPEIWLKKGNGYPWKRL